MFELEDKKKQFKSQTSQDFQSKFKTARNAFYFYLDFLTSQPTITSLLGPATDEHRESSRSSGSTEMFSLDKIVISPLFLVKKMGRLVQDPAPKMVSPKMRRKRKKRQSSTCHFNLRTKHFLANSWILIWQLHLICRNCGYYLLLRVSRYCKFKLKKQNRLFRISLRADVCIPLENTSEDQEWHAVICHRHLVSISV